ncbi:13173_t:CDS:2 [Acaulospora colombiana]|uniref:13173_t:CDS:1 n=1 Tax=Acaulospora colombiana TaxID=27376 RepID=A0ACA9LXI6_9GLOM|nr:13173_t:CDS:2 [Acaulospora colombiana]
MDDNNRVKSEEQERVFRPSEEQERVFRPVIITLLPCKILFILS